ncbi:hypothetical protein [Streptomyces tsukubensis]|uniref:hypothetical protein n=1 Tax=Streptomyces tsukubensis TaxID=83656 RepID=UPI00344BAE4E
MTAEEEEEADLRCEGCIRVGCPDCDSCDCTACSRTAAAPPPQPERRPPTAVAYSVLGHLYEVALPGDATVEAVDGALVIRHGLGPVAGICAVNPMRLEN